MADALFQTLAEYSDESMSRFIENRLRYTSALDLPPSVQFDLARSAMSQDQLREVSRTFGRQDEGWGITDMIDHLTSRDPDKIPVASLQEYQQNLIDRGFAPPNASATGMWDPEWAGASFMFEDENRKQQMAGSHWASTTVTNGLQVLTNTLPSKLYQSIVGGAKGLIEQTPETWGRIGAVGGAAAGAASGTAIVPGAGTLIGAGVGALTGFLGDFLSHDESHEAEDQGLISAANFVDALSPWTEYQPNQSGVKALWEDIGWTLTAAGMAKGASLAVKGVVGIPGTVSAARTGLAEAGQTSPTLARAMGSLASENPTVTGWLAKHSAPLSKILSSDPLSLARGTSALLRPVVGGVTAAGLSARYFGGLGAGTTGKVTDALELAELNKGGPLDEEEINDVKQRVAEQEGSTIEQSIQETPELGGPSIPFLGKVVDLPSLILVPDRLFPWKLGEMAAGFNNFAKLGEQGLMPLATALWSLNAEKGNYMRIGQAVDSARALYGADDAERAINHTFFQQQAGFDSMAQTIVRKIRDERGWKEYSPEIDRQIMEVKANLYEMARSGKIKAEELDKFVTGENRLNFVNWYIQKAGSPERIAAFPTASRLASRVTSDIRNGTLELEEDVRGLLASSQQNISRNTMKAEVASLRGSAEELRAQAAMLNDPEKIAALQGQAAGLENQAHELITALPSPRAGPRTTGNLSVTAARPETYTATDYITDATKYKLLRKRLMELKREARKIEDPMHPLRQQEAQARQEINEFVGIRAEDGNLPAELVEKAMQDTPSTQVSKYWIEKSRYAGADARPYLDAATNAEFDRLGFKPMITGSELWQVDDVHQLASAMNAPMYSHTARLIDSFGLSTLAHSDDSIVKLMQANQKAGLRSELEKAGIRADPDLVFGDLIAETHKDLSRVRVGQALVGKAPVVDVRQLHPEQVLGVLSKYGVDDKAALSIVKKLKQVYGGEVILHKPYDTMKLIAQGMRVNGLPGFGDAIRSWKMPTPAAMPKLVYTAAGVGLGAGSQLFDPDHEYVKGALVGGLGGLALAMGGFGMKNKGYGYLPDRLANLHNLLRFTLSPTFDAGRYAEQNGIAMAKHGLEPMLRPDKWLRANGGKTPWHANASGEETVQAAHRLWDRLTGGAIRNADDLERRMSTAGVLGFVPQKFEAAQALQLWRKHPEWSDDRLLSEVLAIGRYGGGRTSLEKSVNFVFFPFSYSKKLATVFSDAMLQEPARRLILHQLLRNYYLSGTDDKLHSFIEDHAPILKDISRITNFGAYGLSPGRFFLQGLKDRRNPLGTATQILSSVFVPSGAAQPLAETFGKAGDWLMGNFAPVTLTAAQMRDESVIQNLLGYLPVVRDMSAFFNDASEQVTALTEGKSPEAQLDAYLTEKRTFVNEMDPVANAMGYADFDGLRGSEVGAGFQMMYETRMDELSDKYPTGYKLANSFDGMRDAVNSKALNDLAEKVSEGGGTESERHLMEIYRITQMKDMYMTFGFDPALINQIIAGQVRPTAMRYLHDETFVGYYDRFFASEFGPLVVTA